MRNRFFGITFLVLGLLILLTPRFILPACEYQGKMRMICTYMAWSEMAFGALLIAVAVALLLSASSDVLRWFSFVSIAFGVTVIVFPGIIGYCKNPQMPCNYGTVPLLRLWGGLLTLSAIAGFLISFKKGKILIIE